MPPPRLPARRGGGEESGALPTQRRDGRARRPLYRPLLFYYTVQLPGDNPTKLNAIHCHYEN